MLYDAKNSSLYHTSQTVSHRKLFQQLSKDRGVSSTTNMTKLSVKPMQILYSVLFWFPSM